MSLWLHNKQSKWYSSSCQTRTSVLGLMVAKLSSLKSSAYLLMIKVFLTGSYEYLGAQFKGAYSLFKRVS